MPLTVVGYRIWSSTTFWIVLCLKPSAFACAKRRRGWGRRFRASRVLERMAAAARGRRRASCPRSRFRRAGPPVPQPAARRRPAQGEGAAGCAQVRTGGGAGLGECLVAGRIDREDAVEPGDLEDLRDVPVAADEREPAFLGAEPLDAADEHAERCRVDERRVGEVDDDLLAALRDHVEELLLELGRRVEVDLARQRDHVGGVVDLARSCTSKFIAPSRAQESNPSAGWA